MYNFSELLTKQAAARRRKGVVGRTGTKIPTKPSIEHRIPAAINRYFLLNIFTQITLK